MNNLLNFTQLTAAELEPKPGTFSPPVAYRKICGAEQQNALRGDVVHNFTTRGWREDRLEAGS